LPLPVLPDVIFIHLSRFEAEAVQPQPLGAVTLILPAPPPDGNDLLVGEME
jgi:hypothetical protein